MSRSADPEPSGADLAAQEPAPPVDPLTGELCPLDGPTDALGTFLADVREIESRLREAKAVVTAELLARMDREGTWTVRVPGMKITGEAPGRVEYDVEKLRTVVDELVAEGTISQEAAGRAVESRVVWVAHARGVTALRKLGGHVTAALDLCVRPVDRPRRVTVSLLREDMPCA